jgi:uncharacterized membrane protein YkoI
MNTGLELTLGGKKEMRILLTVVIALSALGAETVPAQESETKVDLRGLPPAVQEAVKAQSRGATLRAVSKEVKNDVTLYEAEMKVHGRTKDITFDAHGKIVSVEEQTSLNEIPAAARAAIQKAVGTGKLVLVEKVTHGEKTYYEGHITHGQKALEVKVDANGKPVEP